MSIPVPSGTEITDLLAAHRDIRTQLAADKVIRTENRDVVAALLTVAYMIHVQTITPPPAP